eukprot:TRINITY_DN46030_c0_g1_i2.p1 TRINITY_DN46030_c0_g1~~TRINITY_DN46030_c0_g1_i2.p1  ORF type:complete len:778 (+),score=92.76 TRINITY_DN46030_c0_g1_i2:59-2392(+)
MCQILGGGTIATRAAPAAGAGHETARRIRALAEWVQRNGPKQSTTQAAEALLRRAAEEELPKDGLAPDAAASMLQSAVCLRCSAPEPMLALGRALLDAPPSPTCPPGKRAAAAAAVLPFAENTGLGRAVARIAQTELSSLSARELRIIAAALVRTRDLRKVVVPLLSAWLTAQPPDAEWREAADEVARLAEVAARAASGVEAIAAGRCVEGLLRTAGPMADQMLPQDVGMLLRAAAQSAGALRGGSGRTGGSEAAAVQAAVLAHAAAVAAAAAQRAAHHSGAFAARFTWYEISGLMRAFGSLSAAARGQLGAKTRKLAADFAALAAALGAEVARRLREPPGGDRQEEEDAQQPGGGGALEGARCASVSIVMLSHLHAVQAEELCELAEGLLHALGNKPVHSLPDCGELLARVPVEWNHRELKALRNDAWASSQTPPSGVAARAAAGLSLCDPRLFGGVGGPARRCVASLVLAAVSHQLDAFSAVLCAEALCRARVVPPGACDAIADAVASAEPGAALPYGGALRALGALGHLGAHQAAESQGAPITARAREEAADPSGDSAVPALLCAACGVAAATRARPASMSAAARLAPVWGLRAGELVTAAAGHCLDCGHAADALQTAHLLFPGGQIVRDVAAAASRRAVRMVAAARSDHSVARFTRVALLCPDDGSVCDLVASWVEARGTALAPSDASEVASACATHAGRAGVLSASWAPPPCGSSPPGSARPLGYRAERAALRRGLRCGAAAAPRGPAACAAPGGPGAAAAAGAAAARSARR